MGWFQRLSEGLTKTKKGVRESLQRLVKGGPAQEVIEELEAVLIQADIGVHAASQLVGRLRTQAHGADPSASLRVLKAGLLEMLEPCEAESPERLADGGPKPFVILAVGVNGVGKTTTLAKLAQRYKQAGMKPLLVAADTFRAAAIEQLEVWGRRLGVDVIRHQQGADPSAVVFDGLAAARARGAEVLLIDTAGRLHTKVNLMDELRKMKRVLGREMPGAPHEVLLILDATLGQNALAQARQFHEALGVTGIVLTKLDGTAKGGIVVAISQELKLPVRLIGVGEQLDDLQDFHAQAFVDALCDVDETCSTGGRENRDS